MRVTVLGAGVAGLACAVELAERGAQVEVIECTKGFGTSGCSWFAGGMLAPWCELENTEPVVAHLGHAGLTWWREHFEDTALRGSLVVAHARDTPELERFASSLQFEVELKSLTQLEDFRSLGIGSKGATAKWMHAFSRILVSPPAVEILRVEAS